MVDTELTKPGCGTFIQDPIHKYVLDVVPPLPWKGVSGLHESAHVHRLCYKIFARNFECLLLPAMVCVFNKPKSSSRIRLVAVRLS
jgi:hypothetical protein